MRRRRRRRSPFQEVQTFSDIVAVLVRIHENDATLRKSDGDRADAREESEPLLRFFQAHAQFAQVRSESGAGSRKTASYRYELDQVLKTISRADGLREAVQRIALETGPDVFYPRALLRTFVNAAPLRPGEINERHWTEDKELPVPLSEISISKARTYNELAAQALEAAARGEQVKGYKSEHTPSAVLRYIRDGARLQRGPDEFERPAGRINFDIARALAQIDDASIISETVVEYVGKGIHTLERERRKYEERATVMFSPGELGADARPRREDDVLRAKTQRLSGLPSDGGGADDADVEEPSFGEDGTFFLNAEQVAKIKRDLAEGQASGGVAPVDDDSEITPLKRRSQPRREMPVVKRRPVIAQEIPKVQKPLHSTAEANSSPTRRMILGGMAGAGTIAAAATVAGSSVICGIGAWLQRPTKAGEPEPAPAPNARELGIPKGHMKLTPEEEAYLYEMRDLINVHYAPFVRGLIDRSETVMNKNGEKGGARARREAIAHFGAVEEDLNNYFSWKRVYAYYDDKNEHRRNRKGKWILNDDGSKKEFGSSLAHLGHNDTPGDMSDDYMGFNRYQFEKRGRIDAETLLHEVAHKYLGGQGHKDGIENIPQRDKRFTHAVLADKDYAYYISLLASVPDDVINMYLFFIGEDLKAEPDLSESELLEKIDYYQKDGSSARAWYKTISETYFHNYSGLEPLGITESELSETMREARIHEVMNDRVAEYIQAEIERRKESREAEEGRDTDIPQEASPHGVEQDPVRRDMKRRMR